MTTGTGTGGCGRQKDGPGWRFVPRTPAVGWLSLVAGLLMIAAGVLGLLGHPGPGTTVLDSLVALVGAAQTVRAIDGLRVLNGRGGSGR